MPCLPFVLFLVRDWDLWAVFRLLVVLVVLRILVIIFEIVEVVSGLWGRDGGVEGGLREGSALLALAHQNFVYKLEQLVILNAVGEEVEVVFGLEVGEDVVPRVVWPFEDGIKSHFVVVELPGLDDEVLHDWLTASLLSMGGSKLIASRLGANPFDMGFLTSFFVPLICLPSISI